MPAPAALVCSPGNAILPCREKRDSRHLHKPGLSFDDAAADFAFGQFADDQLAEQEPRELLGVRRKLRVSSMSDGAVQQRVPLPFAERVLAENTGDPVRRLRA
jgi:hypothetical protein